ncbi:MAG: hypothetical protein JRN56_01080 [Nitrososphaerota archaeon]|nr:hypothetical protein [Nitrososphaerota archaeon]MDG6903287.1 hypothetical protein [Nitrososphaerota archaeon]MDG6911852.1 hypothetical protein [Nitrososphaerota archaeon]MDG6940667.1 hypothetical protein [Nitrososphaerota archaeon]MDG6960977.1 hypothetical protein [Nitrososphaerota archaeon]
MDVRRFKDDLYELAGRACHEDGEEVRSKVFAITDILVNLYRKNLVKINHSALELVCARTLIKQGYDVKVEHRLDKILVCDVMGSRGDGRLIVEIETGFIPPEAALEPSAYAQNRISSKIARYSKYAGKFALGTTPSYTLDLPRFFIKPSRNRTREEAVRIKARTDVTYNRPEISIDDLMQARLHMVFLIDIDSASVQEIDPETYDRMAMSVLDWHRTVQGLNPR